MLADNVLLIHLVASVWMTAIIMYVQLVHYPTFHQIIDNKFCEFHESHSRSTTYVVLVPMVLELGSALYLAWLHPTTPYAVIAALTVLTWAFTFLISVPLHNRLGLEKDSQLIARLVSTNWLRVAAWGGKLVWLLLIYRDLKP